MLNSNDQRQPAAIPEAQSSGIIPNCASRCDETIRIHEQPELHLVPFDVMLAVCYGSPVVNERGQDMSL
jgi:hypothetical protein